MNELVSIIIPVYNVKQYIYESIDSAINQTYKNIEIIIIDDGSTDGCKKICDDYSKKDNRISVFHQVNSGLSTTRNIGLDKVHGDYIAFLDSDDAYYPNFIETTLSTMLNEKVNLVIAQYELHNTTGKMYKAGVQVCRPILNSGLYSNKELLSKHIDHIIDGHLCNKLYSKKIWNNLRFLDRRVFEDIEIAYKATYLAERIYVLNKPLYKYRKRPNSITSTMNLDGEHDRLLAYCHVDSFILDHLNDIFTVKQLKKSRQYLFGALKNYKEQLIKNNMIDDIDKLDVINIFENNIERYKT